MSKLRIEEHARERFLPADIDLLCTVRDRLWPQYIDSNADIFSCDRQIDANAVANCGDSHNPHAESHLCSCGVCHSFTSDAYRDSNPTVHRRDTDRDRYSRNQPYGDSHRANSNTDHHSHPGARNTNAIADSHANANALCRRF